MKKPRASASRVSSYASILRSKLHSSDNPTGAPMSLREFSRAIDCSFEHARKLVNVGDPVVSRPLNAAICRFLRLDEDAMWEVAAREKVLRRWGRLSGALQPPSETPLVEAWDQLTDENRGLLTRLAATLIAGQSAQGQDAVAQQGRSDPPPKAVADSHETTSGQSAVPIETKLSGAQRPQTGCHRLDIRFRGGATVVIPLSEGEYLKAFRALQDRRPLPLVPFLPVDGADGRRYAVNCAEVQAWTFTEGSEARWERDTSVRVLPAGQADSLVFDPPDTVPTDDDDFGSLNYVFEAITTAAEPDDAVSLIAADSSRTFLYCGEIALLSAPVSAIDAEQ